MSEPKDPLNYSAVLSKVDGSYKGSVGTLEEVIEEAFAETIRRVLMTGKAGKLTVCLDFSRLDETRIEVKGDIKTKLPEPKTSTRTLYHDRSGNLFADDPNQPNLPNVAPLRKISGGKAE